MKHVECRKDWNDADMASITWHIYYLDRRVDSTWVEYKNQISNGWLKDGFICINNMNGLTEIKRNDIKTSYVLGIGSKWNSMNNGQASFG